MSSPLAVAAVTATLCDLLKTAVEHHDLDAVGSLSVTALPPDRIETGTAEPNRLNVFLYQVTANQGWRNEGLPSHDGRGTRLTNPPLALDLHYLVTAYGQTSFAADILLGFAMEVLHDARVLARGDIRTALGPPDTVSVGQVPADDQGRRAIDLADQIEQLKITPHYLSGDELARLWTAMQSRYRPTVAYQVSTILIQGKRSTRGGVPVLTRGKSDSGVRSQPDLAAPAPLRPTLTTLEIIPATANEVRTAAEPGDALDVAGALLEGTTVKALFRHPLFTKPIERDLEAGPVNNRARLRLPQSHDSAKPGFLAGADDDWPAGSYTVALQIERAGKPTLTTNDLFFSLAPKIVPPLTVGGTPAAPTLPVQFTPKVWPDQRLEAFVGGEGISLVPLTAKTGSVTLAIVGIPPSDEKVPVTLRVDGVETQIVRNRNTEPPAFDEAQKVTVPS